MQILPTGKPVAQDGLDDTRLITVHEGPFPCPENESAACAVTTHWLYSEDFLKSLSFAKAANDQAVQ